MITDIHAFENEANRISLMIVNPVEDDGLTHTGELLEDRQLEVNSSAYLFTDFTFSYFASNGL